MNVFVTYGVTSRETLIGVKIEEIVMECDDFKKKGTIRIKDNDVARLLKEKNQNGKYRDMFLLVTEASLREHTTGFGMRKCPKFTDMFHTMKRVLTQRTA